MPLELGLEGGFYVDEGCLRVRPNHAVQLLGSTDEDFTAVAAQSLPASTDAETTFRVWADIDKPGGARIVGQIVTFGPITLVLGAPVWQNGEPFVMLGDRGNIVHIFAQAWNGSDFAEPSRSVIGHFVQWQP
jgi:hypothetical protein